MQGSNAQQISVSSQATSGISIPPPPVSATLQGPYPLSVADSLLIFLIFPIFVRSRLMTNSDRLLSKKKYSIQPNDLYKLMYSFWFGI